MWDTVRDTGYSILGYRAMGKLTDTKIRHAKPEVDGQLKEVRLWDTNGLYLTIAVSGAKWWRLKFHFMGKERRMGLGKYPEVSLTDARTLRDEALALLRKNIDPQVQKQVDAAQAAARIENSFEKVARKLIKIRGETWTKGYTEKFLNSLENDIFPFLGRRPVAEINGPELLACLRKIEDRNAVDMAKRVCQRCSMVFKFAIAGHLCVHNPAAELPGQLKKHKVKHHKAIDANELHELNCKIRAYDGEPLTRLGLQLMLLTFVRTIELREALWRNIDFDHREWRVPLEGMKNEEPHIIPLSRQAIAVLTQVKTLCRPHSDLVFGQARKRDYPISENTLLYALYRMGYKSRMTVHGFRTVASSELNRAGFRPDVIEFQLSHKEEDSSRAAYNATDYMDERIHMMDAWAKFTEKCGDLVAARAALRRAAKAI